jgi:hypothetical protein
MVVIKSPAAIVILDVILVLVITYKLIFPIHFLLPSLVLKSIYFLILSSFKRN